MCQKRTYYISAKPRGIGIPQDLEKEVKGMLVKSQNQKKYSNRWLQHRNRKDSAQQMVTLSKDYRNIIEGLQVNHSTRTHNHGSHNIL